MLSQRHSRVYIVDLGLFASELFLVTQVDSTKRWWNISQNPAVLGKMGSARRVLEEKRTEKLPNASVASRLRTKLDTNCTSTLGWYYNLHLGMKMFGSMSCCVKDWWLFLVILGVWKQVLSDERSGRSAAAGIPADRAHAKLRAGCLGVSPAFFQKVEVAPFSSALLVLKSVWKVCPACGRFEAGSR